MEEANPVLYTSQILLKIQETSVNVIITLIPQIKGIPKVTFAV